MRAQLSTLYHVVSLLNKPCRSEHENLQDHWLISFPMQVVLDAGYKALWSDMDTAWLKNFFELAPADRDVVLVDDSEEENEQTSDNTCTGTPLSPCMSLSSPLPRWPPAHATSFPGVCT